MNAGRFEQVGTPQQLYYEPQTPFVAGFVGENNRFDGHAIAVRGDTVELSADKNLLLCARRSGPVAVGQAVQSFVRPEVLRLARDAGELPAAQSHYRGQVDSVLFDGANSAVLVREEHTRAEFRIALPQTGAFADLRAGETVAFGFDPERAVCFALKSAATALTQ